LAPPIRIRVTASVDANLGIVFAPLEKAAKQARTTVAKEAAAGSAESKAAYASAANEERRELAKTAKERERYAKDQARLAKETAREEQNAAKQSANEERRQLAQTWRDREQYSRQQDALAKKSNAAAWARGGSFLSGVGHVGGAIAGRIGMGAVSGAMRLGGDLLRGLGVHTDPGEMFAEAQKNEALFRNISSFGYMPNTKTKNNVRVDPDTLLHEAHKIGQATGFSAGEVGEGLEKFVGLTGDLNLGRESLKDMAVLSKATGSSLEEMVEAAGAASNTLGDMPNKATVLYAVMKQVASEGKTGAILIKDMAVQMAKIASSAQMFSGDRAATIGTLGALAQEARGRGGASSASTAATSVVQFANVFKKRQRLDTFTGFGIHAFESEGGGIRDPQKLITESFEAAMWGGFRLTPAGKKLPMQGAFGHMGAKDKGQGWQNFETNLTAMYGDVKAMRATAGFESVFKEGYTGATGTEQQKLAAGTAAVNEEFHRLKVDMMDEATVQEDFALAMKNSKSGVAVLNDKLQETAESFEKDLLPAIVALAPEIELLAKGAAEALAELLGVRKPKAPGADASKSDFDIANAMGGDTEQARQAKDAAVAKAAEEALARASRPTAQGPTKTGGNIATGPEMVPEGTWDSTNQHQAELAAARDIARERVVKTKRDLELARKGAQNYDETGMSAGMDTDVAAAEKAEKSAEKSLMDAEQAAALAKAVSDGVREALASGRMQVIIAEDKTSRGNPPPGVAGKDRTPADGAAP
jgi:hypothetical protein